MTDDDRRIELLKWLSGWRGLWQPNTVVERCHLYEVGQEDLCLSDLNALAAAGALTTQPVPSKPSYYLPPQRVSGGPA